MYANAAAWHGSVNTHNQSAQYSSLYVRDVKLVEEKQVSLALIVLQQTEFVLSTYKATVNKAASEHSPGKEILEIKSRQTEK